MPVTIKTSAMKYKNPDTGQYEGVDMIEEKAVRDIVADDYSPTSPYAVDSYCLYNGDYYRCTTAIQSGEAWNASHWTPTQVSDELVSIKGAVDSIGTNEVENESNVSGATASAALNTLNGAISDVSDDVSDLGTLTKVTVPYTSFSTNKGTIQNACELRIAYNDKYVFCSGYIRLAGLSAGDKPDVTITIPQDVPSFWGYCPPAIRRATNSNVCVIDDPGYFSHTKGYATSVFHCYNYIGENPDGYFQTMIPSVVMT